MASLIDEALANEKGFRAKTARVLWMTAHYSLAVRCEEGDVLPPKMIARLKRRVFVEHSPAIRPALIEALKRIEALDAARWAREQRGR